MVENKSQEHPLESQLSKIKQRAIQVRRDRQEKYPDFPSYEELLYAAQNTHEVLVVYTSDKAEHSHEYPSSNASTHFHTARRLLELGEDGLAMDFFKMEAQMLQSAAQGKFVDHIVEGFRIIGARS